MESFIDLLRRLFGIRARVQAPSDTIVIDQGAYFDSLELRQQRWREDEEEAERQRQRIAYMIWEWARDIVRKRQKLPLAAKLPRGEIRIWLDGLYVQEIFALAQSDAFAIKRHIYSDIRIDSVRRVQKLPPAELRFPAPKAHQDDGSRGAGGGPRKPK